jgi:hypothetical protein
LVIAFTWMPLERPCEAADPLDTNYKKTKESRR